MGISLGRISGLNHAQTQSHQEDIQPNRLPAVLRCAKRICVLQVHVGLHVRAAVSVSKGKGKFTMLHKRA